MEKISFFLLILCFANIGHTDDMEQKDKRLLASDPNYIHQVELDMQDLKEKVGQLSTEFASVMSQNAKLTSKNSDLTSKYTELMSKTADLASNYTKLTSQYTELSSQNEDLKSKYTEVMSKNADLASKISGLESTLEALNNSNKVLERQVRQTNIGSVFIRWGRTECPATAELVHAGYAGGSSPYEYAAAVDYLCMPKSPKWRPIPGTTNSAYVYGGEYESNFHSSTALDDYEVPCAVCRTNRSSVFMFPATTECQDGWTLEYEGDLAAGALGAKAASEYVCLDKAPERASELGYDNNGKRFYPVGSKCGTLPCPPYVDGGQLSCAVCSK